MQVRLDFGLVGQVQVRVRLGYGLGLGLNGPDGFWGLDWAKWVLAKMVWDLGQLDRAKLGLDQGSDHGSGSEVRGPKRWATVELGSGQYHQDPGFADFDPPIGFLRSFEICVLLEISQ